MARQNFARRMGPFVRVSINASAHCRNCFLKTFVATSKAALLVLGVERRLVCGSELGQKCSHDSSVGTVTGQRNV